MFIVTVDSLLVNVSGSLPASFDENPLEIIPISMILISMILISMIM